MAFTPVQQRFRFYNDDGSLSTATPAGAENSNITVADAGGNQSFHLLLQVQETGNTSGATTDDYQLQYSKNGGAYANITTGTTNVKAFASANVADAGSISSGNARLTAGSGAYVNGLISEDGLVDNIRLTSNDYTEFLYTVQTIDANLAVGDTLDFRVLYNGAALSGGYTVTPRITITTAPQTYNETLTASIAAAATQSATRVNNPTLSEAVTAADVLDVVGSIGVALSESVTLADSNVALAVFESAISESVILSDSLSYPGVFNETLSESVTLADSNAAGAVMSAALSEGVTPADSVAALRILNPTLTESVTPNATLVNHAVFTAARSESVAPAMSLAVQVVGVPIWELPIRTVTWMWTCPSTVHVSPWDGSRVVVSDPWSARWAAKVELAPTQGERNFLPIRQFFAKRRGSLVPFRLYAVTEPQNDNNGVTLSASAAQGATSVSLSGAATPLKDGQHLTINGQLLMATADQSGSNVTFQPPLRKAASSGTVVVTSRPYAYVYLLGKTIEWQVGPGQVYESGFDVQEAVVEVDPDTVPENG